MRYKVGNLIRGEAAEYVKATCADLSSRFGITDVNTIIAPHFTIKSPFDFRNQEMIENLVADCANTAPHPMQLNGWNNFGTRTIYIDVPAPSAELKQSLTAILDKFKAARIPTTALEYDLHLHLSVARFLTPQNYTAVADYIKSIPAPKFDINLDNLTIFGKELNEKSWKIIKTFPLIGK